MGSKALAAYLTEQQRGHLAEPVNFCPSAECPVAYFDGLERLVLATDLQRPAYPKDPEAPICACFGLTRADIEQDVREGGVRRTKDALEKAKSKEARCWEMAANGRPCVAYVQKYYLKCRADNE